MSEKRVLGSPACVGQAGWLLEGKDNLVPGGAALCLAGSACGAAGLTGWGWGGVGEWVVTEPRRHGEHGLSGGMHFRQ